MNIIGTSGNDTLNGTDQDDLMSGFQGEDSISGNAGDDEIYGNQDNDLLNGGAGNDSVFGGKDNDIIIGAEGSDELHGNQGNDIIDGDYRDESDTDTAGIQGDDAIYGEEGDDIVVAGGGNDIVYGNQGHDLLSGGEGNDQLYGGQGNDYLSGGRGINVLTGGAGIDTFGFNPLGLIDPITADAASSEAIISGDKATHITDFNASEDKFAILGLNISEIHITDNVAGSADNIESVINLATGVESSGNIQIVEVNEGELSNQTFMVYNVQGTESAIELTGLTGTITAESFTSFNTPITI